MKKFKKIADRPLIPSCLAVVLLGAGLFTWEAKSYYVLLRFIVCVSFIYLTLTAYTRDHLNWIWVLGALTLLYNPVFPVKLSREVWSAVNLIAIFLIGITIWLFRDKRDQLASSENFPAAPSVKKEGRIFQEPVVKECQLCGQMKPTLQVSFDKNISYFYERRTEHFIRFVCHRCMTSTFVSYELTTLLYTWWGIIGMFLGPPFLLGNLYEFVRHSVSFARAAKQTPP